MTDDSVIKALKCFVENKDLTFDYCKGCIFDGEPLCSENASEGIAKAALGLINRQQEEIESLKRQNSIVNRFLSEAWERIEELSKLNETVKVEAIKEFVSAIEKRLEHNWDASWEVFHSVMGSIHELAASRGVE